MPIQHAWRAQTADLPPMRDQRVSGARKAFASHVRAVISQSWPPQPYLLARGGGRGGVYRRQVAGIGNDGRPSRFSPFDHGGRPALDREASEPSNLGAHIMSSNASLPARWNIEASAKDRRGAQIVACGERQGHEAARKIFRYSPSAAVAELDDPARSPPSLGGGDGVGPPKS